MGEYDGLHNCPNCASIMREVDTLQAEIGDLQTRLATAEKEAEDWRVGHQCLEKTLAAVEKERDEAQRNYLNTKGWWNAEREKVRKHEGTIAGMQTEIAELEARAEAAEALLDDWRKETRAYTYPECEECSIVGPLLRETDSLLKRE